MSHKLTRYLDFRNRNYSNEVELLSYSSEEFIIHEDGCSTKNSEKMFKCETCGKVFLQHGRLIHHLSTHNGEWPFKCNIYGKEFSYSSQVLEQCHSHSGEKPFQCEICEKKYQKQGYLYAHHQQKHPSGEVSTCSVCKRRFSVDGGVIKYHRTDIGGHFFRCTVCGK
jgi:KRAB domain-containing zinc finger protein